MQSTNKIQYINAATTHTSSVASSFSKWVTQRGFTHTPRNQSGKKGARAPLPFRMRGHTMLPSPSLFTRKYFYCWSFSFAWMKSSRKYDGKVWSAKIRPNFYLLTILATGGFAPNPLCLWTPTLTPSYRAHHKSWPTLLIVRRRF